VKFAAAERALWDAFGVAPSEQWLDLPTTRVRALVLGDGPTIVFIHGASNSASSWVNLAAKLPDFRCVMLDRPGCGLSPKLAAPLTAKADLERFADTLVGDVVDALGGAPAHVVATSFGGYFALRSAAAAPERFDKLATLSWSVGAPIAYTPFIMRVGASPRLSRLTTRMPAPKVMVKPMLRQIGLADALTSGAFSPVMIDWFHALLRDTHTMRNEVSQLPPLMTMRGMNEDLLLGDDVLGRITTPTLMLWGKADPMGGEETAAAFSASVPSATLEMVRGGHAPWIDDADGIATRLRSFFA
jgi:2-hydroxy-6-oxonona-2,4-dienedioate hydrolase